MDFNTVCFLCCIFFSADRSGVALLHTNRDRRSAGGRTEYYTMCTSWTDTLLSASSCRPPIHRGPVGRTGIAGDHRTAGRAARSVAVVAAVALTIVLNDSCDWRARAGPPPSATNKEQVVVAFPANRRRVSPRRRWGPAAASVVQTMVGGGDTAVPARRSSCGPGGPGGPFCYRGHATITAVVTATAVYRGCGRC